MSSICIITARGGSKRIPRKNLKPFLGKPILEYAIEAALQSKLFETVMVSTDDDEIAEVGKRAGAEVPFRRSDDNSSDYASTADVLAEVLERYAAQGQNFEFACCCYPTAVFASAEKLVAATQELVAKDADSIFPVAPYSTPILRAFRIEDEKLQFVWPEHEFSRSQDLGECYYDTGQFYIFRVQPFLRARSILCGKTVPFIVSPMEAQDIDDELDWRMAELKYQLLKENQ